MKRRIVAGHELLTDGRRFWVNGPDGAAVARFSPTAGRDVHRPLSEQSSAGTGLHVLPSSAAVAGRKPDGSNAMVLPTHRLATELAPTGDSASRAEG